MNCAGVSPANSAVGAWISGRATMASFSPQAGRTRYDHGLMLIAAPCVVSLTWALSDAQGEPIDELVEPLEFFYGGDDLLPKIEEALAGHQAGDELLLHLEPEHAFGDYDSKLVCFEARELFGQAVEPGMQFEGLPAGAQTAGMPADTIYIVTEVYPSHVVLDGNHPLAGIALNLQLTVRGVREATADEIEIGSVGADAIAALGLTPDPNRLH
jgi:FKBP-type peptidyl-prolyl cis-trans isomerase SlyD